MIDITLRISEKMSVYKNLEEKKPKLIGRFSSPVYETEMTINLHTGTHVDYPKHMIPNGKTSNEFKTEDFIGKCYVFDMTYLNRRILKKDILNIHVSTYDFILFKTKNSYSDDFEDDFVYLSEEAAEYLSKEDIKGIGIDSLSVEREQPDYPTHKLLLGNDKLVYEGLNLKDVEEGIYEFIGLPMNIDHVEASPVRAVLRKM